MNDSKNIDNAKNKLKIIEDNMFLSEGKNWIKLTKTEKLVRLNAFAKKYCEEFEIDTRENELAVFLKKKLDQKRLVSVKELVYDTDNGEISSINGLEHDDEKFILKRADKRKSTLKSLAPKKNQTIKIKLNNNKKKL